MLLLFPVPLAKAQEFAEPGDEDYTIDLYQGAAIGSVRIIGMGGSAMATAQGSAGALVNPAAPGVRPATSNDRWDWDWHLDSTTAELGSDFDNNGILTEDASFAPQLTAGLVGQYRQWAVALVVNSLTSVRTLQSANATRIENELNVTKLLLARSLANDQIVIGGGLRAGKLSVTTTEPSEAQVLMVTGANLEIGAVWKPDGEDFRVGSSASLPVVSNESNSEDCAAPCPDVPVPSRVAVPWQTGIGFAARTAPTSWNQKVKTPFRDERYLLWSVDLLLTGKVARGFGLEAFTQNKLQPSGRKFAVSVRGGVEYEWFPGRFRVRGGSYFEPSRFKNPTGDSIPGRVHLTVGLDLRVWSFNFWDDPYRVRLSATGDVARRYGNGGLSLGLWH